MERPVDFDIFCHKCAYKNVGDGDLIAFVCYECMDNPLREPAIPKNFVKPKNQEREE